ncbi:MAG: hypothetical protein R3330_04855, partial [Saprospiraceae bacterium]|nr:hypothetical protein [Saprospiraceae bacterium]
DRLMLLLADETYNRMRIITPIHMAEQLDPDELKAAMTANFHTALDVRYAISEGVVWSAFLHPLRELSRAQLTDALAQVYRAAESFGTTYSSTELVFPGGTDQKVNQKPKKKM